MDKSDTAAKYGEDQVKIWRRSYDIGPPLMDENDERHPKNDRRYAKVPLDVIPRGESLKTVVDRVLPYWYDAICPLIKEDKKIIVVAHGNSLRAIVKHLSGMNE